ncbi:Periplasmic thiol:disulfide interchange protein DsbA [Bartonella ancashensis]|uniref:Periplasmic thiol:disulfide interchange protein DsbA n=2 Tax=Bartonella ancashensis TaxID=1318743 RepID=A0A0M4LHD2_9HYPH|nr:Periplasmic thiol:disulfide interchange protein DsbA [Bartonella ancashensis]
MFHRHFFSFFRVFFTFSVIMLSHEATAFAGAMRSAPAVDMVKLLQSGGVSDRSEGDVNAPVVIVEYASLTCVHCADFYNSILPEIRKKYIKTGKVRLIFRDFAFDPRATAGFMLARCVPEDRYFPLISVLFQKQNEWAWVQDALTPLRKIGSMAGLTDEGFDSCLQNQSILDEVNASAERGRELGVTATPTFFINGYKYEGLMSMDKFSSIIDSFL